MECLGTVVTWWDPYPKSISQVTVWRIEDGSRELREVRDDQAGGDKGSGSGCTLEVEPVVFAGELHVEWKGKKGVK